MLYFFLSKIKLLYTIYAVYLLQYVIMIIAE